MSQINFYRDDFRIQKCRKSGISFGLEKRVHLLRSGTKMKCLDMLVLLITLVYKRLRP